MRFVAKIAVIILFSAASASAQEQKPPTFHSQAELVTIPAVVTDHSGAHVAGLKKEDFSVLENGVEQKIAVCEEIRTTTDRVTRAADLGKHVFSNYLMGAPSMRRVTVIVFDAINTPFADQAFGRSQLMKFLGSWAETGEPIAFVAITRSGVRVIHDFTTDPHVLAEAVKRVTMPQNQLTEQPTGEAGPEEDPIMTANATAKSLMEFQAELLENMASFQRRVAATITMESMQQIAQAYAGVPGRKSLIWASSGFPFSISDQTVSLGPPNRDSVTDVLPLYQRTWQMLNDAQFSVYPVDLRGLVVINPGANVRRPSKNFNEMMNWNDQQRIATFESIAESTGGRAFINTNDLAGAFRKAVDDSASYYLLGYYRDARDTKPGWRKLKVNARKGLQIRARSGFFIRATATEPEQQRKQELDMAFRSPVEYTALGFEVSWKPATPGANGKKHVPFDVGLPAGAVEVDAADNNHMRIEVFAVAKNAEGASVGQASQTIDGHLKPETVDKVKNSGINYTGAFDIPAGDYTVRFVVRDSLNGHIGTVTAPLKLD